MLSNEYPEIVNERTETPTKKKDANEEREKLNREFVKKKSRTGSTPPSCYQACSPTSLSTTGGGSQFYARVTPGYQNMIAKNISIVTSPSSSFSFPSSSHPYISLCTYRTFSNPTLTATSSSKTAHSPSQKNLPMERIPFRDVIVVRRGIIGDIRRKNVV